jgi:hypothetical protein
MKKILLTTLTALLAFTSQAQFQLGILTDYHYCNLYNKSDAAADARLDYVATYKPAFGAVIGYKINDKFAVQISPQYFEAGQKFIGVPSLNVKKLTDNIALHYFQLPIQLNYCLSKWESKLKHSIFIGGYFSNLLSYKQTINYGEYSITSLNKLKSQSFIYDNLEGTNTGVFQTSGSDSSITYDFGITKRKFNATDIGTMLGYIVSYQINKQSTISMTTNIRYGFSQIDNKDTLEVYLKNNPSIKSSHSILEDYYCRDNVYNGSVTSLRDPKSNNISLGLQLSFIYTLPNKKSKK